MERSAASAEEALRTHDGCELGLQHARENEAEHREFMENPVVEELPVDGEASRHFAEIVVDLRRAGTPLPTNDLWIAATAARHSAPVLTYDRHFEKIARVGAVVLGS